MQSLLILGRQPALGLAELESLFGANKVQPVGAVGALVDGAASDVPFERLGGSVKCAEVLSILPETGWRAIEKHLYGLAGSIASRLAEGKVQIGISAYGFHESTSQLTATGLSLKKALRKLDRSVRLTPNTEAALSSAQVYHNHLTSDHAWEVIILRDGDRTIFGRTTAVQDIDSYTLRDRGRPKRDSRVGMLPPKLAQTIINLSVGQLSAADAPQVAKTVLDPFCGTGVVLQEAQLMGYNAYGTDLEQRMVDYSRTNLDWLPTVIALPIVSTQLEQGDATNHTWQPAPDFVAAETYLGRPFTTVPDPATLKQTISECNLIIKKFLRNIQGQIKPGTRLCLAIPAWQVKSDSFQHLPLVDSLEEIGYNRVSFEHVRNEELLYYREDQIVARQLLVLTKI